MKALLGLSLLLLVSLWLGCAPESEEAPVDTSLQDFDAVVALIGDFVTHYNANDSASLTALFAEDGMRIPPDDDPFQGHTRIGSEFDADFEGGAGGMVVNHQETLMGRDLAFTRGTWAITIEPEDGDPTSVLGTWVNLVERQDDGSWRISRNMWNTEDE